LLAVDIDEVSAKQTAEACRAIGGGVAVAYGCDVADPDAVADLTAGVHAEHGPLDVLVNNAGVGLTGELLSMTFADWQWVRSVNLDGPVHCLRAFGPAMIERRRGHVVNVSSALAYVPRATEPAYVATKCGLVALSRSVRADWCRWGVGVSVVCPGVTNTDIIQHTRFVGRRDDPVVRARTAGLFGAVTRPPRWRGPSSMPSTGTGRSCSSAGRRGWHGRSTVPPLCGFNSAWRWS
jgi:2-hydroxycyclohexanecarboxyl-CoA dehydrogenase